MMDLYEALGVPKDATPEQIKAAHRKSVKEHHPDAGGSKEKFQLIQLAYDTLKDADRRERYDRTGETAHAEEADPALMHLATIFQGMIVEMLNEGLDIETRDMGALAKDAMEKKLGEIVAERKAKEKALKRADVLVKRWKRKRKAKGFDFIGDSLRRGQRDIQEQIDKHKQAEAVWERAIKILGDYTYKFDEKPQQPGPAWTQDPVAAFPWLRVNIPNP
jgi:curved DNA-binding protein CbpA